MRLLAIMFALCLLPAASAQRTALPPAQQTPAPSHRTRLYLKDGTYQLVLNYRIDGSVVRYHSAERAGASEDIPLALIDMKKTQQWQRDHAAIKDDTARTVLSPELAAEEADRAARTPEVAPNLRLPEEDAVLVLDTYEARPELVPLNQQGGDLNKQTAHNVLRKPMNPLAAPHDIFAVPGTRADVQVHVAEPVFYMRLSSKSDATADVGGAMVVDTHNAAGRDVPAAGSANSDYVLVRVDVRYDVRELQSFRINFLGGVKPQPDVIELNFERLPGGHWLRMTPKQPLDFGEYALVEILDAGTINSAVWDFGVHPQAPENADALLPEAPRKPELLPR